MLRRQARRPWRKPPNRFHAQRACFVILKLLRISLILRSPHFMSVVPDREISDAKHILIASGKVGHGVKSGTPAGAKYSSTAILFLDQLYPLPRPEIAAALDRHSNAREVIWSEEPRNMGAFFYVMPASRSDGPGT